MCPSQKETLTPPGCWLRAVWDVQRGNAPRSELHGALELMAPDFGTELHFIQGRAVGVVLLVIQATREVEQAARVFALVLPHLAEHHGAKTPLDSAVGGVFGDKTW